MSSHRFTAFLTDVRDLCAALHVLVDAAEKRGDTDSAGVLHLLARCAESICEQAEQIAAGVVA